MLKNIKISQDDIDKYKLDSGNCHALAVAIGQLSGEKYSIGVCVREVYDEDGDFVCQSFSHATAMIGINHYDANGSDADIRWESKWDSESYTDEDGERSEFTWHKIKNSPTLEDVILFVSGHLKLKCNKDVNYEEFKKNITPLIVQKDIKRNMSM